MKNTFRAGDKMKLKSQLLIVIVALFVAGCVPLGKHTGNSGRTAGKAENGMSTQIAASSLDKEIVFPKCEMWKHKYGVDTDMTDEKCRLDDLQVQEIIQRGLDVNQWNDFGQTPLMLAKSAQSVKGLIEAGADVNHGDEFGNTVLEYATSAEIVDLVVHAPGFDINNVEITDYNRNVDVLISLDKSGLLVSDDADDDEFNMYLDFFELALEENSLDGVQYMYQRLTHIISDGQDAGLIGDDENKLWDKSGYRSEVQDIINRSDEKCSEQIIDFLMSKGFVISACRIIDPKIIAKLSQNGSDVWCDGIPLTVNNVAMLGETFSLIDDNTKDILAKRLLKKYNSLEVMQFLMSYKGKLKCIDQQTLNRLLKETENMEVASLLVANGAKFEKDLSISSINNRVALKYYIEHGGNVNVSIGASPYTLLNKAILLNDTQMVRMLLNAGADVKVADQYAGGVIIAALNEQNDEIVELLIKAGADINRESHGDSTLDLAIQNDNIELLKHLIQAGLDANPEKISCQYLNSIDMLKYLLTIGLKADDGIMMQLCDPYAGDCPGKHFDEDETLEIMKILNAAKQTSKTDRSDLLNNDTAADDADMSDKAGSKVSENEENGSNGFELIHALSIIESDGDDSTGHWVRDSSYLRKALENGADPNMRDKNGRTPLMYAQFPKEARILLAAGADINATDNQGNSVLMAQVENYWNADEVEADVDVISYLLKAGADTSIRNLNGETVFDIYSRGKSEYLAGYQSDGRSIFYFEEQMSTNDKH